WERGGVVLRRLFDQQRHEAVGEFEGGVFEGFFAGGVLGDVDGDVHLAVGGDEFAGGVGERDFDAGSTGNQVAAAHAEFAEGFAGDGGDVGAAGDFVGGHDFEADGLQEDHQLGLGGGVDDGAREVLL